MKIKFECTCGQVTGTIDTRGLKGYRAVCFCDDCQAFARQLGREDLIDLNGGTDVIPVTPASLKFDRGIKLLKCMRLKPEGMFRWYAECCKTPLGNTPPSAKLPFVGMNRRVLLKTNSEEVLERSFGPIQARIFGKYGIGALPPNTSERVNLGFVWRVLKFAGLGLLRRQPSPFRIPRAYDKL